MTEARLKDTKLCYIIQNTQSCRYGSIRIIMIRQLKPLQAILIIEVALLHVTCSQRKLLFLVFLRFLQQRCSKNGKRTRNSKLQLFSPSSTSERIYSKQPYRQFIISLLLKLSISHEQQYWSFFTGSEPCSSF
jgi:hypothetical protein